ncbi:MULTISPECIES: DUF975 family protein [Enterococcus]|uniref:DUF975 family protein n=1 Tax=Enterococcus TaxID=1350 RepID=UPI001D163314|nr:MULTISPECIES: DUF975 family protein [Enterococcus]UOO46979.1 DUF975 family protein [Enterococcus casseliflavus]
MRSNTMIRETAKNSLRGFWGTFVLSILATVAVQAVVSSLFSSIGTSFGANNAGSWIDLILDNFVFFAFSVALSIMALYLVRGRGIQVADIFLVFDKRLYVPFLLLNLVSALLNYLLSFAIFLPQFVLSGLNQYLDLVLNFNRGISVDVAMFNGSVAFVIGTFLSIILFFFLSQVVTGVIQLAIYLRYDQPELGVLQSIKVAFALLRPHLGQYIWLQLSLIGWFILGFLALLIGMLWANAYAYAVNAAFYEELINEQRALIR